MRVYFWDVGKDCYFRAFVPANITVEAILTEIIPTIIGGKFDTSLNIQLVRIGYKAIAKSKDNLKKEAIDVDVQVIPYWQTLSSAGISDDEIFAMDLIHKCYLQDVHALEEKYIRIASTQVYFSDGIRNRYIRAWVRNDCAARDIIQYMVPYVFESTSSISPLLRLVKTGDLIIQKHDGNIVRQANKTEPRIVPYWQALIDAGVKKNEVLSLEQFKYLDEPNDMNTEKIVIGIYSGLKDVK